MTLGENIKRLRKKKNWSQSELAVKIGSHLSHINRIETGKYRPSLPVLMKLAAILEVSLDNLVTGEGDSIQEVKIEDKNLAQRLKLMESLLDAEDKKALIRVIDSMLTKNKILQFITKNQELQV